MLRPASKQFILTNSNLRPKTTTKKKNTTKNKNPKQTKNPQALKKKKGNKKKKPNTSKCFYFQPAFLVHYIIYLWHSSS